MVVIRENFTTLKTCMFQSQRTGSMVGCDVMAQVVGVSEGRSTNITGDSWQDILGSLSTIMAVD